MEATGFTTGTGTEHPLEAYPRRGMTRRRTNDAWLRDLRSRGAAQASALEDLRVYLLRALPTSLKRHGAVPNDLVEDVVQEALLRTLDHLDRFEGRSRFTTWATAITARLALTELRRRRWKDVPLEAVIADAEGSSDPRDNGSANAEAEAARHEIMEAMAQVMDEALNDRQRTALIAELRGMPQEEIGRRLGINRNAVYKLGFDARKKMRRGLEARGFNAEEIRTAFN